MTLDSLAGKTAVITGATSGIGEVVANRLAAAGARVLIIARDDKRGQATLNTLEKPSRGSHGLFLADLSRLDDMKRVSAEIAGSEPVVDLLINNAGAEFQTRQVTSDGLEQTFALNHMSYFVVTLGLLDRLRAAPQGRVVSTASRLHASASLDFSDLQSSRNYKGYAAYGRSKLCNILFTRALARRLAGTSVTANAVHPGFVATGFGDKDRSPMGTLFKWMKVIAIPPARGALTTLYVATSEEGGRESGAYFADSRKATPSHAATNSIDAERLWSVSLELAGLSGAAA